MTDESGLAVASAFREASEADTLVVFSAQSKGTTTEGKAVYVAKPNGKGVEELRFYLVGAAWFQKAWSTVLKPPTSIPASWAEDVGPIDNSGILPMDAQPQDATTTTAGQPTQQPKHIGTANRPLRVDLQHERDFYLVGSHAWLLLQSKFGCSSVCSKPVVAHKSIDSTLAVDLSGGGSRTATSLVPIPGTGRFPYERIVAPAANPAMNLSEKIPADDDGAVVHDEDLPDLESADGDDGIGGAVKREKHNEPVLLLPPSTTTTLYSPIGQKSDSVPESSDDFGFSGSNTSSADDYWRMETDTTNFTTITKYERYKYGSGLGNLGNTCFMNSTLQCLGHTHALQEYFLTGEFQRDLNRGNPLGTGGELATEFAKLLTEMWTNETAITTSLSSDQAVQNNTPVWSSDSGPTVYPRDFKYTVGKHAEQFLGYDQHDSQEFATYLLDALHEDTNRVTQKPYFDKPEQEEGESDKAAADKAWGLHLQRENSRVLQNFMGQVKSRVQCCEPGCNRVSTTFDPFMYLSVPIPGSQDREFKIKYVPLDPTKRIQSFSITAPKTFKIRDLSKRVLETVQKSQKIDENLGEDDLTAMDVFHNDIYTWHSPDDETDKIKDSDDTWVFGLRPSADIREHTPETTRNGNGLDLYNIDSSQTKHYQLDIGTMTRLNKGDAWRDDFSKYLSNSLGFVNAFHPTKGSTDDQVKYFQKTTSFLDTVHEKINPDKDQTSALSVNEESVTEIVEFCEKSPSFENVKSLHDLAVLEFCQGQMRKDILRLFEEKKKDGSGGVMIYVRMKTEYHRNLHHGNLPPFVLRIPATMSTYELRQEIAKRLSRSLRRPEDVHMASSSSGQATSEAEGALETEAPAYDHDLDARMFGSSDLNVLRQVPLTFERKSPKYHAKPLAQPFGSVAERRSYYAVANDSNRSPSFAMENHDEERRIVARVVGDCGIVNLEWPRELFDRIDQNEYSEMDDPEKKDTDMDNGAPMTRARKASNSSFTVLDCIEKYCQMEQLEETEMWYCNRCKKHVRAWKQFHLYRAPPVLIVHLKRFQYSATTHRRDKISKFIDFPLENLDLSGQVKFWNEGEKPVYDCYAVSNHYGGLGGGHYTAHALNDDGVWCYYDDSRVSKGVETSSIQSDAAYVLYYRRRGAGNNDPDFLLTLTQDNFLPDPDPGPAIIYDAPVQPDQSQNNDTTPRADIVQDDDDDMDVDSHTTHGSTDGVAEFQEGEDDQFDVEHEPPRQ